MSGHSKWSTIKRKKGANDAKRGQLFAKLVKAIEIAARNGGTDPANNASLYQAIQKAKSNSVPNENIERALKRVDGNLETGEIFELSYEGYAPHGVALLISCLTDNKNRTSSDVKATLTKHGGSMGTPGSVNYLFERKAVFQFDKYNDELIDLALNSDCLDILESNQSVTFEFPPSDFKNMNEITIAEMGKIGINISDPTQLVGTMSGGQRQTLAIARAIYFGAKILILDEPTSALGQKQQMEVLKTIKKVQQLGNIAIILITHNEIHARLIADRFTFLSLGEVIGSGKSSELGGDDVKRLMAGGAQIGDLAKELEAV